MIIEYRQDNLIKLLRDFYVLTGMRVTVSIMFWLFMRPPPRSQALRPEAP